MSWVVTANLLSATAVSDPIAFRFTRAVIHVPAIPYAIMLDGKIAYVPLLQFNEEYHGTGSKPSNYIRTQLYMMSWFKQYTRQAGGRVTNTSQP